MLEFFITCSPRDSHISLTCYTNIDHMIITCFLPAVIYPVSATLRHAIFLGDIFPVLFHVLRHSCSRRRQLVQQDYLAPQSPRLVAERETKILIICNTKYLWCYSECISTPGKLQNLPDHGENRTRDLWFAKSNALLTELNSE